MLISQQQNLLRLNIRLAEPSLFFSVLTELTQAIEVATAHTSGLLNLDFSCQTSSFSSACIFLFSDKTIFITETAVPNARLLGLGSKLYPINIHFMHNEDLTRFTQIRQNQAREIKALLRRSSNLTYSLFSRRIFRQEISYLNLPFRCIIPGLSIVRVIASRHFNVATFCFDVHIKARSISVVCG